MIRPATRKPLMQEYRFLLTNRSDLTMLLA